MEAKAKSQAAETRAQLFTIDDGIVRLKVSSSRDSKELW